MTAKWGFVVTDKYGSKIGEVLNATERKYVANLSKPSTGAFQTRIDNPLLPHFFEEEDNLIQVWEGSTLRCWGPIISTQMTMTDGAPPSVAVNFADPAWWLTLREAGKSRTGTVFSGDKGTAANSIITALNGENASGLAAGTDTCGSTGSFTAGPFKEALACIQELADGFGGFDWYVEPFTAPEATAQLPNFGKLRLAAVVGSEKPSAVFEYGTGRRNMRAMSFLRDKSTQANVAWHLAEEGLESAAAPWVVYEDAPSVAKYRRMETLTELTGVKNQAERESWVRENVEIRKSPRRILSMTSDIDDGTGRVPQFGTDYWLGDLVPARGVTQGGVLFDGLTRVYAAEVALNNAGDATVTPILVEEAES